MPTTEKRITLPLTKEDKRILDSLCNELGETSSGVIRRALMYYSMHYKDLKINKDINSDRAKMLIYLIENDLIKTEYLKCQPFKNE
jgi:hypothetical protein